MRLGRTRCPLALSGSGPWGFPRLCERDYEKNGGEERENLLQTPHLFSCCGGCNLEILGKKKKTDSWLSANNKCDSKRRLMGKAAWTRVTSAVELLPDLRQWLSWTWTPDVDSRQKDLRLQRQSDGRRASKLCRRRCNVSALHAEWFYFFYKLCAGATPFTSEDLDESHRRFWKHFKVGSWTTFWPSPSKRCQADWTFFFCFVFLKQQCLITCCLVLPQSSKAPNERDHFNR